MKPWHRSWTIWVNALVLICGALAETLPMLESEIPRGAFVWLTFALAMVNLLLRGKTTQPICMRRSTADRPYYRRGGDA